MTWSRSGLWVLVLCAWSVLGACGPESFEEPAGLPSDATAEITPAPSPSVPEDTAVLTPPASVPPSSGEAQAPVPVEPPSASQPVPVPSPAAAFQPAFHQALRWSKNVSGLTTFRMRVPMGKAGGRIRVTFRSGDGTLSLQKATVARTSTTGAAASQPIQLTFNGSSGFTAGARKLVTSDPLVFPVGFREDLAISFEMTGAAATSAINAFPGSFMRSGAYSGLTGALGGQSFQQAIGIATVDVEATSGASIVAIGDSITEGYIDTYNDLRNSWPSLVEQQLGRPVVNAAVSGQGFWGELQNVDQEVLKLSGATDCVVLLGTNDLTSLSVADLEARMTTLLTKLKPFCRLWVSTLLPKEKTNYGTYEQVKADRVAFNAWIRQQTLANVIDLEAVTRSPTSVHLFIDGLEVDGIHPSAQGHRVMAAEVVRVLKARGGL